MIPLAQSRVTMNILKTCLHKTISFIKFLLGAILVEKRLSGPVQDLPNHIYPRKVVCAGPWAGPEGDFFCAYGFDIIYIIRQL